MISTGAFQDEMDASNKQETVVAKLVNAWEKKNAKVARAGGVSLMALSLAACGSDDDDDAVSAADPAPADPAPVTPVDPEPVAPVNQSLMLTAGFDVISGGAGNDVISGGVSSAGTQTLNTLDSISGGAGTDTLSAQISTNVTPGSSGVEVYNIVATGAATLDLAGSTDVTSVTNNGSTALLTVTNVGGDVALAVQNTASGATFNYAAADVLGTADAKTVTLSTVTGGTVNMGTGVESLTVHSTGSANSIAALSTSATTLTITGDAALTIAAAGELTAQTTIDASAATGAITLQSDAATNVTITTGSGKDAITADGANAIKETINTGAGNDTVTFDANLADADVVDGGEGTDTLTSTYALLNGLSTAAATARNISNFEKVALSDAFGGGGTLTLSSIQQTGLTTVTTSATNNAGAATVNYNAGAGNVLNQASVLGGQLNLDAAGSATDDAVTLNVTDSGADAINAQTISTTDFETMTLDTSGKGAAVAQTLGTVTMAASLGGTTTFIVKGDNSIDTSGVITAGTIDFSGVTAAAGVTMGAAAASVTSITGSAGTDTLTGDASSTIDGGAGNDIITGGTSHDTLTGGAGNDTITTNTGNDTVDAGDGNDTVNMDSGLSNKDVIKGGLGSDTLRIDAAATAATASGVSGFETFSADTAMTQDMAVFASNGTFTSLDVNVAGTVTFSNVGTAVTSLYNTTTGGTAVVTRLVDGSANSLSVYAQDTTSGNEGVTTFAKITASDEETLSLVSGSNAGEDLTLTDLASTDLKTINASGTADVKITNAITLATDLATVDASGLSGALEVHGQVSAVNMTITGGSGGNEVTTGAGADTITGGNGADIIISGEGADTITTGAGIDSITAGAGVDTIHTGAGADTVIMTGISAGATTVSTDKISSGGFTTGASQDQVDITVTAVEAILGGSNDLVTPGATSTSVAGGTAAELLYVTAAYDLGGDTSISMLAIGGTFANTSTLETALETGGSRQLTANEAYAANDQFLVLYDDGVNTYLAAAETSAVVANDAQFAAGNLTITNILTFEGMSDVTTAAFSTASGATANFDFV